MLEFAIDTAYQAGNELKDFFNRDFEIKTKSTDRDLVTEADFASEKIITTAIKESFPEHAIMAEESGRSGREKSDYLWVVDPLDGTNNYAHRLPFFCVAMALVHRGEVVLAVTLDPCRDELFTAEKGKGATLNGKKISVSRQQKLSESIIATGFPYDRATNPKNNLAEFNRIMPLVQGIRRYGSAALDMAYVACGRLDGYWEFHLKPWDFAGGTLLVSEAGGKVSSADGSLWVLESDSVITGNPRIYPELYKIINNHTRGGGFDDASVRG